MFSKIVILAAIAVCVSAQKYETRPYHGNEQHQQVPAIAKAVFKTPIQTAAVIKTPLIGAYHAAPAQHEQYPDAHPQYSFEYAVKDEETHDMHNQHEERDGDVVKGYYSLVQPDGITRTVHYTADHHKGFNAQVEYSGHADHPQVQKAAVAKAAPIYQAPVHHAYHH